LGKVTEKFSSLLVQKQKALVPFFTAFYPTEKKFETLLEAADSLGADFIEIGVPFSDPLADGKMIQYSSQWALENCFTYSRLLERVAALQDRLQSPLIIMAYINSILSRGSARIGQELRNAGVSGMIIPDLPWEESGLLKTELLKHEIDLIQLVAPTTSSQRLQDICDNSQGFVYLVSLTGVTGIRHDLPKHLVDYIGRVRGITSNPLCVGFGISNTAQAQMVSELADGVIIGSAFINIMKGRETEKAAVQDVIRFMQDLRNAV
jgi:tryptophan synthase alpha chain